MKLIRMPLLTPIMLALLTARVRPQLNDLRGTSLPSKTQFIFYDKNNRETNSTKCFETKLFSMIVPGYTESCDVPWVRELRQNLLTYRDGCLICMDYSEYNRDYPFLLTHFRAVAKVLRDELISYREKGSKLSDAYVFGFSYGARLIVRAGDDIGNRQLGIMHLCDPAGPGFDRYQSTIEMRNVAQHSQCIHTNSKGRGTEERSCDQNWHMGRCGEQQPASGPKPYGHHGLCPIFYNNAFKYKFMAIDKTRTCTSSLTARDLTTLPPEGIRMGYFQKTYTSALMNGVNLYAITKKDPPYC